MIQKETERHKMAFEAYFELRNYAAVAKKFGVTRAAVDNWKKAFDWENRTMLRDQEIAKGVKEKLLPEWIDMKAYLLKTLIEQVKLAREAGVVPTSTRDIVAAIKEIRSIMGESDAVDITGSVNISLDDTLKEYEETIKRIVASDTAEDDTRNCIEQPLCPA